MAPAQASLSKGVFTISLDFELLWGGLNRYGPQAFRRAVEIEREQVIDRLLALFAEFQVPATWCTIGHLFLERCEPVAGVKHPDIVRPTHAFQPDDWFLHDPCSDEAHEPLLYGRSLIEQLRRCPVPQEIGSHSFSHVIFGDPGCSADTARTEIAACVRAAQELGVELRSFAFPRNSIGHLETLRAAGFTCYRGPEPYELLPLPRAAHRLLHLAAVLAAWPPPVHLPQRTASGLWNVPGSMLYTPMHGRRRYIPGSLRVRRAIKGLNKAARRQRIFHLWFHPTNMADEPETMFAGLRAILQHADALRRRDLLDFRTMGDLVPASDS